jgi:transposase
MSKQVVSSQVFCGIDVSAATLAAALQRIEREEGFEHREFPNSAAGHRELIAWLRKRGAAVRVALEATGIYSFDLALALDKADGIEVAVLNPKDANRFAQSLYRSKTDKADAAALCEHSRRMKFEPWRAPSQVALQLRVIGRHLAALSQDRTRMSNRLEAAKGSAATPRCVLQDLKRGMGTIEKRIVKLRREGMAMIATDGELKRRFDLMVAMPGIGETSAVLLLSELAALAPGLTARQWVASSGLDPAHTKSGTSVDKPSRISRSGSKYLRRSLSMPALVGVRFDPHLKAFYLALQARRKTKLQALMAVARKLLHAIFGIFKTGTAWDGAKLFPQLIPNS